MKKSLNLLITLILVSFFSACSTSENESEEELTPKGLIGDYKCVKLVVHDRELGEQIIGNIQLTLKEDSTYAGQDMDRINSKIEQTGKWDLTSNGDSLKLGQVGFSLEKNNTDTLQLLCESFDVQFHVTLLRKNKTGIQN